MEIKKIVLTARMASLIGFAKKSRGMAGGFEAVRRSLERGKIALLLVDSNLSPNSLKKMNQLARAYKTPVWVAYSNDESASLFEIAGVKIVGIHHGDIARDFLQKLNQEIK